MRPSKLLLPFLALLLCLPLIVGADALRQGHPERYVVQRGDTLWDISNRFLRSPWLWPEIWYHNPEIENPHLIYPGDVISLIYVDGEPRLTVQREDRSGPTVRLSPRVREESISAAIPTIPLDAIRPFLTETRLLDGRTLANAPYIVAGADERVMGSGTDTVYGRGSTQTPTRDATPSSAAATNYATRIRGAA
ncbi:LysM peptidoglycan-binding domain-containing protein [Alkalilimnicola ehrlichii]|uniref:LysM peptidoglycan-binding domain-containing protein n=1 Tax=Alkalilimnicola ehrlichii TaxID=351052 RepID=UPI002163008C|nr:LysM peptidoglycan-binding domain-containing protein [Alkalilimnicola ehrlichii]